MAADLTTTESWHSFIKDLPADMVTPDLPKLLEKEMPLAVFRANTPKWQQNILIEALGKDNQLIDAIITRIQGFAVPVAPPVNYASLALKHKLAPSTQLNYEDVVDVLNTILRLQCMDMRALCKYLSGIQPKVNGETCAKNERSSTNVVATIAGHYQHTLHIGDKEASGGVILGLFMDAVRAVLQNESPNTVFLLDHAFKVLRGEQFACDEAVQAVLAGISKRVTFCLNYKPKVAPDLKDQQAFHISETLLQAYYLWTQFSHDILHCLSDLVDYHFFLVGSSNQGTFCVKQYWYRECDLTNTSQTEKLLDFLFYAIQ